LFNDSGRAVKTFDNYIKFEREEKNWYSRYDYAMKPFKVAQHIYVKELANDTLYCLNEHNELIPQYVYNMGQYTVPKHWREKPQISLSQLQTLSSSQLSVSHLYDVLHIPNSNGTYPMVGTPNYIFFSIDGLLKSLPLPKGIKRTALVMGQMHDFESRELLGVYDIVNKKNRLLDTDPVSRMSGLINDLDGGLSFWPRYYTSENELVDVLQAYDMKETLTEKYFAGHTIKNSQAHQKLKELVKNLNEEDNPVIVIAKLK
jgi:hypothetical protein